jgi:SpoVK/Ycf46/Vps4 family AAA+-type ATPase
LSKYTGWTQSGGGTYEASIDTTPTLPAGLYGTVRTQSGLYFILEEQSDRELLRFPDSPGDAVVDELADFWTKAEQFDKHGLPHKRGVLLYGPPGSGKTCTVQLICRDVIARDGLVFEFSGAFAGAYGVLRSVEPERPLVVLMEDIDSIITPQNESGILQVLDGIGAMRKVVFIATTNYPERLGDRLVNRPSRFDRKVLVGHPSAAGRRMYLESLMVDGDSFDVERWVADTEDLSMAHVKELFVAVNILENPYEQSLADLRGMKRRATSDDGDPVLDAGFGRYA